MRNRLLVWSFGIALAASLVGCGRDGPTEGPPDPDTSPAPASPDTSSAPTNSAPSPDSASPAPSPVPTAASDPVRAPLPNPRFVTKRGAFEPPCPDPYAAACVQDYVRLAARLRPDVQDWAAQDASITSELRALNDAEHSPDAAPTRWSADWVDLHDGTPRARVADEVRRRLGLDALLEADEVVVHLHEEGLETAPRRMRMMLDHPSLGRFDAVLRLPQTDGPVPLLLVLPGHLSGDSFEQDVWSGLSGQAMVEGGFGLVVARPRGADADAVETTAALRLLATEHSLLGAHAAEAWLLARALEHLRSERLLPPGRTGLLGHSSGALVGNALCALASADPAPPFEACVNDLQSDYFKILCEGDRCWVLDETDPHLRGARFVLSQAPTLPSLWPRPPYGLVAEDGSDRELRRALDFFRARLH